MPTQRDVLPQLVRKCTAISSPCALVLIGSVARGAEHEQSDIDLNLIFPGDTQPLDVHTYVAEDNRWQLIRKDIVEGFRIDIAWETENRLRERVTSDEVAGCWPISCGEILHDPNHIATESVMIAKQWFRDHAEITQQFESKYAEAKRRI